MSEWVISVSQLNEYVRKLISGDPMLRNIRVRGEISGFKRHVSGHLYFTLKDEEARVQCVMFRQSALGLSFQPRDGMRVTANCSASLYAQSGAYQLYVDGMIQEGAGELFLRFEALKRKLSAGGLFDPSLKKPIPMLPQVVGVVTSRTGAVLRDVVRVAGRRNPDVNILLAAASVQGAGAAEEIVAALERLNQDGRSDVILCGRGGGSIEDLWPFNEEIVARAIARSKIPVISCVGHETDFTIADFAADMRAPTPSAAAELAVPVKAELLGEIDMLAARLARSVMNRQELCRARLTRLSQSQALTAPRRAMLKPRVQTLERLCERLTRAAEGEQAKRRSALRREAVRLAGARHRTPTEARRQETDALTLRMERALRTRLAAESQRQEAGRNRLVGLIGRMERGVDRKLKESRAQADMLSRALGELNPSAVLDRGYAAVYVGGRPVCDAASLRPDMQISVRMRDGAVAAKVLEQVK